MTWPPDIADELPAPQDDEPASLRRDIADELADHLVTSLSRELHFTSDESAAKVTILDRFGDPRRIARQLWFDALQEKIMSQRVLIGAVLILAIGCLGGAGLMVMLVRQVADANQVMQEQMAQNREANAALLDKLATLASRSSASQEQPRSMEWNPVKVRLVKDVAGGIPAEGFRVELKGHLLDTAKEIEIERATGTDGIADIGLVRPGQHTLRVSSPWNERRSDATLTVLPGHKHIEEVVCPSALAPETEAAFEVGWPETLSGQGLWLVARVERLPRTIGGTTWRTSDASSVLTITPDVCWSAPFALMDRGRLHQFGFTTRKFAPEDSGALYFEPATIISRRRGPRSAQDSPQPESESNQSFRPYVYRFPAGKVPGLARLPVGEYRISTLLVAEPPAKDPVDDWQSVDVVGGLLSDFGQTGQGLPPKPYQFVPVGFFPRSGVPMRNPFSDWGSADEPVDWQRNLKAQPIFELKVAESNRVTIVIPPLLEAHVRNFFEWAN